MSAKSLDPNRAGVNWASDEIVEEWSRNQHDETKSLDQQQK
jgi:hypothetical protein